MKTKTLHFRAVNISRNKPTPDNAVKACAYRSGQHLYDQKEQRTHYYGNRHGVIETAIFAPQNAPGWMRDPDQKRVWERFGNEVERVEDGHNRRASALLGKDFQVAAPRELTHEQNWVLAQSFSQNLNDRGLAVAVAYHVEPASDGSSNPHFHFFVPMREVNEEGFGKRYRSLDAPGKGRENPEMKALRHEYYAQVNAALSEAGVKGVTYDPEKQEGKEPGVHKGKHASALEKQGQKSYLAEYNKLVGYNNFMRQYDNAAKETPNHWLMPPLVEKENWHKKYAEWQLLRGAATASRDASQKSQSNVAAPTRDRSERRTDRVRQAALLSYQQTTSYQQRGEKSPPNGPERSR